MTLLPSCLERGDRGAKAYRASYTPLSRSFPPCIQRCHRPYIRNLERSRALLTEGAMIRHVSGPSCCARSARDWYDYEVDKRPYLETIHPDLDADELALSEAVG